MALSPAKRHFQRVNAALAASAPQLTMAGATAYELQMAQLHQDRLRLKQIQSEKGKAELKRQLLPNYAPYVAGVLEAGKGAQDDVLATIMLWRLDAGDYSGGLDIADYVLPHGIKMDDRFTRTPACLVAEEVANAALRAFKADGGFDLALLDRTAEMTAKQDMPDQVRAKLHLARGRAELAPIDETQLDDAAVERIKRAEAHFIRGIELHENCGAKKDLEKAQRLLKKHAGTTG